MKKILSACFIFVLLFASCRKGNMDSGDLQGSWKLIEVYDKNSASFNYPPITTNMDVVITFINHNSFAGHTYRNTLTDGNYAINGNQIMFKNFSMTKIGEDKWGGSLLTVLNSCSLQSSASCEPSLYSVQGNILKIYTPLRYDLTLKKI